MSSECGVTKFSYNYFVNRFRARGPQIHRKMDLAQFPVGPKGSPDDPLADPYDDPSYSFEFKTPEYDRNENADSNGRVNGELIFQNILGVL